jgi:predicted metal-dependent hydrolase
MIKKIFFACLFLVSLAACKSKAAFEYSQNFVKKERALSPDMMSTEEKVKNFLAKEEFDSIGYAGEQMEKMVDAKLKEIKDQPAPDAKEGDNFKESGLKYFNYIKSIYTSYKNFGYAKTPESREEEMTRLKAIVDKKSDAIEEIQRAQKKYADANGFKLEDK